MSLSITDTQEGAGRHNLRAPAGENCDRALSQQQRATYRALIICVQFVTTTSGAWCSMLEQMTRKRPSSLVS